VPSYKYFNVLNWFDSTLKDFGIFWLGHLFWLLLQTNWAFCQSFGHPDLTPLCHLAAETDNCFILIFTNKNYF
jgi:hypothetical protein